MEVSLPLLSNIELVRARHYLIDLKTDVVNCSFSGKIIIFFDIPSVCELQGKFCKDVCNCSLLDTSSYKSKNCKFPIILECCDMKINHVKEIKARSDQYIKDYLCGEYYENKNAFEDWINNEKVDLDFMQDDWSVRITNKELFDTIDFPKAIYIEYTTDPKGESIYWREFDGDQFCFTAGSFINNRSLIPSQDRPFAMATWQAWVTVPLEYYVSMTGDEEPLIMKSKINSNSFGNSNNSFKESTFYYFTKMVLPLATIAISIGKWHKDVIISPSESKIYNKNFNKYKIPDIICSHVQYHCHLKRESSLNGPLIAVTVVSPKEFILKSKNLLRFIKYILIAGFKILGIHPFSRLEIVIMPRCFPHIGLASPNLLFISKSIIYDDSSFYLRLAHEISHNWFGINIGPKNWEEEWISEGFATYLEDSIYVLALEESREQRKEAFKLDDLSNKYSEFFLLRGHLRYKTLLDEKNNSEEELQILCPDKLSPTLGEGSINNGLNANKSFLQVHYLKGYFLLLHLSNLVSRHHFDSFLGMIAIKCHGQLISSIEFLEIFFSHFPELNIEKDPVSVILKEWLNNSDLNSEITDSFGTLTGSKLIEAVEEHYDYWMSYNAGGSVIKQNNNLDSEARNTLLTNYKISYSDQIILLFEKFLQCKILKVFSLNSIKSFYNVGNQNPEIQHRWCELLIKFHHPDTNDVTQFLIENQAMGVYLYGELMISKKKKNKKLAKDLFLYLKQELSTNAKSVISSMVFGE